MNLTDVAHLLQASDCLLHDREFLRAIADVLDGDGMCVASVNDALVVLYGHPYPALIKYQPVLCDKGVNSGLKSIVEMGHVQLLAEAFTVKSFIERDIK